MLFFKTNPQRKKKEFEKALPSANIREMWMDKKYCKSSSKIWNVVSDRSQISDEKDNQ